MVSEEGLLNTITRNEVHQMSEAPLEGEMKIIEAQVGLQPLISEQTIRAGTLQMPL